ncbi:hypothetical protein K523DRAFT_323798 [Schizophyllum commune Tattone D]|nr:hypothetical protein K523DRAFT_323798 [Schizophyllum commune Tattone D]
MSVSLDPPTSTSSTDRAPFALRPRGKLLTPSIDALCSNTPLEDLRRPLPISPHPSLQFTATSPRWAGRAARVPVGGKCHET